MSEFINSLRINSTGNRYAYYSGLQMTVDREYCAYKAQDEYIASVEWKRKFVSLDNTKELIFRTVRKELQELIYGEFKVLLFLLERAIYEEDNKKQLEILGKIYKEIEHG